ncbi:hypothetical protein [Clostridium gasigenes]|uniref:hypothetical protein n=1 Tax=Clostridium gasigenes TaxID=94869 RepID=UPI001C0CDAF0|nr:hypothetical protein [Clostridium gasigenes]MBU3106698.1 hypothetical protein [Clostridium gasigenes]
MSESDLEKITLKIKYGIRKIAGNSGYGYLNCYNDHWKDASDYVRAFRTMDTRYLKNCLNEIKKCDRNIDLKFSFIDEVIDLSEYKLTQEDKLEIVSIGESFLLKLINEKKEEIKTEIDSR